MSFSQSDLVIEQYWKGKTLTALKKFVSLPSKSPAFDVSWEKHGYLLQALKDAACWGKEQIPHGSFTIHEQKGVTPCLFFDIPSTKNNVSDSVLFYGHLDKQPEAQGWSNGRKPFIPTQEGNRLYGRGCADDGYSFYAAVTAIKAMQDTGIEHPRIVGIIETCEETGHEDLSHWLNQLSPKCGNVGLLVVLDGSAADYERLWTTTSFRGLLAATVRIRVLENGVHSGNASGLVPDSFMILRSLLNRIENAENGEVLGDAFYACIPKERLTQLKRTSEVLADQYKAEFPWANGVVCSRYANTYDNLLAKTWKPQLCTIGADGFPSLADAGNVMRSESAMRISMRIPAHVDTKKSADYLVRTLSTDIPFNAQACVENIAFADGWDAKPEKTWFSNAANAASRELFKQDAEYLSDGASIPILNRFEECFPNAQFFITGVLGPESNAHGPNEMLNLSYVEKLTKAITRIISAMP